MSDRSRQGRKVYLSSPHMGTEEEALVEDAFRSNWIAPLGPHVDAFEKEFCETVGAPYGVALNSGTAALHLGLLLVGVKPGDEVLVSTLTFAASVNPIIYLGGRPVFIDSERRSWNMDPALLEETLKTRAHSGCLPRALVVVHLYGQTADMDSIMALCDRYEIPVVEDAAEALGAKHGDRAPGTLGRAGVYSFNGNKIITTSGGGMLVSGEGDLVEHARKLAAQAREPFVHYEHTEIGYNYRLSNVLAAIGRGQLRVLEERVRLRRSRFEFYREALGDLPGLEFMPEAPWGRHSRWLTTLTIDPAQFGADHEQVRLALEADDIEARPLWKPMHQQPVFAGYERVGGSVADELFERGLCLPSGSNLSIEELERTEAIVREVAATGGNRVARRQRQAGARMAATSHPAGPPATPPVALTTTLSLGQNGPVGVRGRKAAAARRSAAEPNPVSGGGRLAGMRIAVIGAGKLGETLIRALLETKVVEPGQIMATTGHAETIAQKAQAYGIQGTTDNADAAGQAEVVILSVKPQMMDEVLGSIHDAVGKGQLIISTAAGVTIGSLERGLPSGVPVIRTMPNTPCLVREGMIAISGGSAAGPEHLALAADLFSTFGRVLVVDERHMDAVTGLSASGPAFMYVILESLAEGGVAVGLPRGVATELAAQTMLGAARMVLETGEHPAKLKDVVTTPAGCTIDGLLELESGGLRVTLIKTIVRATRRAGQLMKG